MGTWFLIIVMQSNSGGIDIERFEDKVTCQAAGQVIERTIHELDPHTFSGRVNWRCVEVPGNGSGTSADRVAD